MAVEEHIHAVPRRTADAQTVYPEGVVVFDVTEKRIYVGDGRTAGGLPIPSNSELQAVLASLEALSAKITEYNENMINIARQQAIALG